MSAVKKQRHIHGVFPLRNGTSRHVPRRLSTRAQGAYATTYEYRFGDKLRRVASTFPGDAPETRFVYDGFRHRRGMGDGTNYLKWWRWDMGWKLMSEHNDDGTNTWGIGTQTRAYVNTAEVIGADTATGAYRYRINDHLGSTRALYDGNKAPLGHYEYTPYVDPWLHTGAQTDKLYTGHAWTDRINLYYAPYLFYDPANERWTSRDPLGMVDGPNMYIYAKAMPSILNDIMGLSCESDYEQCIEQAEDNYSRELDVIYRWYGSQKLLLVEIAAVGCLMTCAFTIVGFGLCFAGCMGTMILGGLTSIDQVKDIDETNARHRFESARSACRKKRDKCRECSQTDD